MALRDTVRTSVVIGSDTGCRLSFFGLSNFLLLCAVKAALFLLPLLHSRPVPAWCSTQRQERYFGDCCAEAVFWVSRKSRSPAASTR